MARISITPKEWTFAIVVSFCITASTFIPYAYGYLSAPHDKYYTSIGVNNNYDTPTYSAWIEQARRGHILFKELYSSEPQPRVLFHPVFFLLGTVARWTDMSSTVAYHVGRLIFAFAFFMLVYIFVAAITLEIGLRKFAFLLIATSSGLGVSLSSNLPNFWMTESTTYLSVYQLLLNGASLFIIVSIFLLALVFFQEKSRKWGLCAGILLLLLALIHTYDVIVVLAVLGAYSLYMVYKKEIWVLRNYYIMVLVGFMGILWQIWVLWKNPILGIWTNFQTSVPAPPFFQLALGFGLPVVLAVVGIFLSLRSTIIPYKFLSLWITMSVLLIYNPLLYRFQRKFADGLHIPLAMMAAFVIYTLFDKLGLKKGWGKNFILGVLVVYFSLANVLIIWRDISFYKTRQLPYYIKMNEARAIDWLGSHGSNNDVILSGQELGNRIPGMNGKTVYMGHYDQTINFYEKYDLVQHLFASDVVPGPHDPLLFFLKQNGITYILQDEEMKSWGTIKLDTKPYLSLAYQNSDVAIYQVR
jgi:hypothetical protein